MASNNYYFNFVKDRYTPLRPYFVHIEGYTSPYVINRIDSLLSYTNNADYINIQRITYAGRTNTYQSLPTITKFSVVSSDGTHSYNSNKAWTITPNSTVTPSEYDNTAGYTYVFYKNYQYRPTKYISDTCNSSKKYTLISGSDEDKVVNAPNSSNSIIDAFSWFNYTAGERDGEKHFSYVARPRPFKVTTWNVNNAGTGFISTYVSTHYDNAVLHPLDTDEKTLLPAIGNSQYSYVMSIEQDPGGISKFSYIHISDVIKDFFDTSKITGTGAAFSLGQKGAEKRSTKIYKSSELKCFGSWTRTTNVSGNTASESEPQDTYSVRAYHDSDYNISMDTIPTSWYSANTRNAFFQHWDMSTKAYVKVGTDFGEELRNAAAEGKTSGVTITYDIPTFSVANSVFTDYWSFYYATYAPATIFLAYDTSFGGDTDLFPWFSENAYSISAHSDSNGVPESGYLYNVPISSDTNPIITVGEMYIKYPTGTLTPDDYIPKWTHDGNTFYIQKNGDTTYIANNFGKTFELQEGDKYTIMPYHWVIQDTITPKYNNSLNYTPCPITAISVANDDSYRNYYKVQWNTAGVSNCYFITNMPVQYTAYADIDYTKYGHFDGFKLVLADDNGILQADYSYNTTRTPQANAYSAQIWETATNMTSTTYLDALPMHYMRVKHPSTISDLYKKLTILTRYLTIDDSTLTGSLTCTDASADTIDIIPSKATDGRRYIGYNKSGKYSVSIDSSVAANVKSIKLNVYKYRNSTENTYELVGSATGASSAEYTFTQGSTNTFATVEIEELGTQYITISNDTTSSTTDYSAGFLISSEKNVYNTQTNSSGVGEKPLNSDDTSSLKLTGVNLIGTNSAAMKLGSLTISGTNASGSSFTKTIQYDKSNLPITLNDTSKYNLNIITTFVKNDTFSVSFSGDEAKYDLEASTASYTLFDSTGVDSGGTASKLAYIDNFVINNFSISKTKKNDTDNYTYADIYNVVGLIGIKDSKQIFSISVDFDSAHIRTTCKNKTVVPMFATIISANDSITIMPVIYKCEFSAYSIIGSQNLEYTVNFGNSYTIDKTTEQIVGDFAYSSNFAVSQCTPTNENYKFAYMDVITKEYTDATFSTVKATHRSSLDSDRITKLNTNYSLDSLSATLAPYIKVFFEPYFTKEENTSSVVFNNTSNADYQVQYTINSGSKVTISVDAKGTKSIQVSGGDTFVISAISVDTNYKGYSVDNSNILINNEKYTIGTSKAIVKDTIYNVTVPVNFDASAINYYLTLDNTGLEDGSKLKYGVNMDRPYFKFSGNSTDWITISAYNILVNLEKKKSTDQSKIQVSVSYCGDNKTVEIPNASSLEFGFGLTSLNTSYYIEDTEKYCPYISDASKYNWTLPVGGAFKKNESNDWVYLVNINNTSAYKFSGTLVPYSISKGELFESKEVMFENEASTSNNVYLPTDADVESPQDYGVVMNKCGLTINDKFVECKYRLNVITTEIPATENKSFVTFKNEYPNTDILFKVAMTLNGTKMFGDGILITKDSPITADYNPLITNTATISVTLANADSVTTEFKLTDINGNKIGGPATTGGFTISDVVISDDSNTFIIK